MKKKILLILALSLLLSISLVSAINDNLGFEDWTSSMPNSWNTDGKFMEVKQSPAFTQGSYSLALYMKDTNAGGINIGSTYGGVIFAEASQTMDFTDIENILFDWKSENGCSQGTPFTVEKFKVYIDNEMIYEKEPICGGSGTEEGRDILINTKSYSGLHTLKFYREKACEQCGFGGSSSLFKVDNLRLAQKTIPPPPEQPKTYYRFEDNKCTQISILSSQKTTNDYELKEDCEKNIEKDYFKLIGLIASGIIIAIFISIVVFIIIKKKGKRK